MKISIKTKDIELNYEDEYSKIEAFTVQNINTIIEKVFSESIKKELNSNPSQVIRSTPNGISPTFFNIPDIN